jgi:N-acetylneuraminic acid mutarotase
MNHSLPKTLIHLLMCMSALVSGGTWQTGVPLNTPREGAASVVMGNYIYIMGGKSLNGSILNTVERFNPDSGVWESTTVAPFDTPRMNAAAIVHKDSIFLTGGRDQSNDVIDEVEVYDPAQNLWHSAQHMRRKREGHTLASINNEIYAIGGQEMIGQYVEEVEWYDEINGDWKEADFDIEHPRVAFFSTVYHDIFYMCGGFYFDPLINSYYILPQSTNWFSGPNMGTSRGGGASAMLDDSLYMIGGETYSGITDSVEIYDIQNRQIIPGPNLPIARKGMSAVTLNDKIYVIGGVTSQSGTTPTTLVQVYTIVTGISDSGNPNLMRSARLVGYPNPFNSTIHFKLVIPRSGFSNLTVYDLQGRRIRQLINEPLVQGTHFFRWDGEDSGNRPVASGIYFAILKGDRFYQTLKIFYVK